MVLELSCCVSVLFNSGAVVFHGAGGVPPAHNFSKKQSALIFLFYDVSSWRPESKFLNLGDIAHDRDRQKGRAGIVQRSAAGARNYGMGDGRKLESIVQQQVPFVGSCKLHSRMLNVARLPLCRP